MNRLDRYIARRYLANCIALYVVLFTFVVGIDVFLNLSRFIRAARALDPDGSSLKIVATTGLAIIDLWGPRLLQLFNYLSGFVIVMGAGFTAASMVRRRELVAALASGVSLQRLCAPMAFAAICVIGAQALNQEFLLPRVAHLLPRDAKDMGQRQLETFRVTLLRDGSGRLWDAGSFEPSEQTLERIAIWERDGDGHVTRRISASRAVWDGAAWVLEDGVGERPGGPGRTERVDRVETDLDPTVILIRQVAGFGQSLSWRQINRAMSQRTTPIDETTRKRLNRIRFGRIAMMMSNLCVLLIALPVFLTRTPVNMASRAFRITPVIAIAMIGSVVGVTSPLPGLPVWLAVFFPPLVLAPIAIAAISNMKT